MAPTTDDITAATSVGTCQGHTRSGARCRRRAIEGSMFCALHADQAQPTMPADIDRDELADAIADLGGPDDNASASGTGTGSGTHARSAGPVDELRQMADYLGENVGRIRDVAVGSGIVDDGLLERILADCAHALHGLAQAVAERVSGDYEEDDFGFDEAFTEHLLPLATLLYRYWWRVDIEGIENVPGTGRGLLVSNHAGAGMPFDGAMIKTAMFLEHSQPRHVRLLVLDWLMGLPWLADLMKQTGQVLASSPNAYELLKRDQLIAVFPEGVKGMAKPFSERYNLQRFGRGGFVRIALRTRTPIIPVAVVGSEEIYPKIANLPIVNRLIGAPFVPVTPLFPLFGLLGAIPLPSKWNIEFCEPIDVSQYPPEAADDRAFVLELSERVRATIQERLKANLLKRRTPFW
ncbi:MAG: Phospholipid/glycerol acyltransferase [Thermoleophilia bacterium]|nr:Phospholipid/glycerol acyltransferase [Thermoleophilia bacterium]